MKNLLLVAAGLLALTGGALALSQSLPSTLPSRNRQYYGVAAPGSQAWMFHIGAKHYRARISYDEINAGPDWNPSLPLSLSFSKAEQAARAELQKLIGDTASWEVTELRLKRIPNEPQSPPLRLSLVGPETDQSKWFCLIGMTPREKDSQQKHDSFFVVMNLSGVVGRIEEDDSASK